MNTILRTLLLLLVTTLAVAAHESKPTVSDLGWLSGCWESSRNGREIVEQWMKPAGGMMLGMGRTVANGKTLEYEFVQIREDKDGAIYYVARPSGQSEAAFKLVKLEGRMAVFENPGHDFPQRIIYRIQPDGSLLARIEGVSKGKERGIDYAMKRTQCE